MCMFDILEMTEDQFGETQRKEGEKAALLLKEQIDDMFGSEIQEGFFIEPESMEHRTNQLKNRLRRTLRLYDLGAPFIIIQNEVKMTKEALEALKQKISI